MLVAIGLVYLIMVILFRSLLVPLVILFALLLAVIGGFVVLDVSLQPAPLPVTVSAAGMWIAYSISGGLYGVALAATAMLSMAGIVVAVDSYGPITGYAGGIVEMAELPHGGSATLDDIFTDLPGRPPVRKSHGDVLRRV
jgi:hypothetical protein